MTKQQKKQKARHLYVFSAYSEEIRSLSEKLYCTKGMTPSAAFEAALHFYDMWDLFGEGT